MSSELENATEIPMGRDKGITKTLQREKTSLYFSAVMMDTEGGRKIFPYFKTVEYAQIKIFLLQEEKSIDLFSPHFLATRAYSQLNLCMTDWRLPLFGCYRKFSLLATAN